MAYNILGINPGHNGSAALISDGELIYYLEEERLSRFKRDGNPFRTIIDICSKYKIDELAIAGTNDPLESSTLPWTHESPYVALVRKYYPKVKVTNFNTVHHLTHASCAFSNSGFNKAGILIVDGAGSLIEMEPDKNSEDLTEKISAYECESIWKFDFNNPPDFLYGTLGRNSIPSYSNEIFNLNHSVTIGKAYEAVTAYLGWHSLEAGKTMGLAPYGKYNPSLPPLFYNGRGNKNVFSPWYPQGAKIDVENNLIFSRTHTPTEWHYDESKISNIEKDLAWQIQNDTQKEVIKLIEKTIKLTGLKQICCAGGYFLNCVTNYHLIKHFPDIEFYFEPMSNDGGTSIGAAQLLSQNLYKKQTSIYYGPQYTLNHYLETLKSYNTMFNQYKITPEQVAKLISERNIVTIFQGRSEAGPRALGNRSILYDPTDPNGKDYVNKVKNREWFRPFAGSVLKEKAAEWFDMAGLEESPFMMYAMDVWPDKQEKIKAITHVDGTCRIQTVTEEQNPHYYKLIQEFEKITGVPILFNTSFNLAGDPLVETLEDALETMLKSEMKYLYLPELEMLLEKK